MRPGGCSRAAQPSDAGAHVARDRAETLLVVEVVPAVTTRARFLLNAYPLRASDAVQLASCYYLQDRLGYDVPFVVFDQRLAAAAQATGATVLGAGETE